ncbi:carbon-nitrogen hydrolase family protein [Candidatus Uabimicrobium sp. HlEnr_7]|uniref:carbon-nitrogen hydrolase family protein n=1 Tax=Candidatus Uabimicrobium helgolandensis TaxID=3095367 RepID=UPI003557BD08
MIRVGVVQINTSCSKQENLQKIDKYVEQAAQENCDLVAFPELFNCMVEKKLMKENAEDENGFTCSHLKELAKKHSLYILGGSILYTNDSLELPQNRSFFYSPKGELLADYAKIHLFDIDIPNQVTHFESQRITPGNSIVNVKTDIGNIGLSICYDLRFPELFAKLRSKGAEIITLPAAFTYQTGKSHWEVLIRARAIETQTFIIAPNQCGKLPIGIEAYGHSMVCDPWGKVLAQAEENEGIIFADLDVDYLQKIRREMPVWNHKVLN